MVARGGHVGGVARQREAAAAGAHAGAARSELIDSSRSSAARELVGRLGVDHEAGLTLDHSLRRAAGAAGDDRQAGEGRLGEDDAEALDLETAEARARGAGEDVGRLQPEAQLVGRDLAGQMDAVGDAGGGRLPAQLVGQAAAAHQGEPHVGETPPSRSASASISMSWPLRATRRPTHTTSGAVVRGRAPPERPRRRPACVWA